jgi:hypothetical protein
VSLANFVEIGPPNERQGRYVHTSLSVWWCGDEVCNCHQVQVVRQYENRLFRGAWWPVLIWQGEFFTDGEGVEERNQELVQAFFDVNLRYPNEKWGSVTVPASPEDYQPDYSEAKALENRASHPSGRPAVEIPHPAPVIGEPLND